MTEKSDLSEEERRGLYDEEIEKLVDGLLCDVSSGDVKTRQHGVTQLARAISHSRYTADCDEMKEVLKLK